MKSVHSVVGQNLLIIRSGRELLRVEHVAFGVQDAGRSLHDATVQVRETHSSLSEEQRETAKPEHRAGTCVVILGPNGAGKSLLVKTLCALQTPDSGQVLWDQSAPDQHRRYQVGLMLQKPVLLRRSAEANLVHALRLKGYDWQQGLRLSRDALHKAGLSPIARVGALRLSGGEQQRLALLRALLLEPDILFLDEATASVDPGSTFAIEQELQQAKERGVHIVMVSHDIAQAKRLADEVILMHRGKIVERAECEAFFSSPQKNHSRRWIAGELLV